MDRRRRAILASILLGGVALAAWLLSPRAALERLEWLAADPLRYALACVALAAVRPLLAWPTTLVAVAVGFGFGPAGVGFALVLFVATSFPPYLVARRFEGAGRLAAASERFVDVAGDRRSIIASRLLPTPSDAVSVGAGLAGVSTRPFLVGTAIGETPWAVAGTLAGASLQSLARGDLSVDPRLVAAAALVGLLVLVEPARRLLRNRR
jgi:uncharacterized membrane protein YdjX (TVP38/TMEM64 family)